MVDRPPDRLHLRLLHSDESYATADELLAVDEPVIESGQVLRRRYTVTVQPDGAELIDDVEEWSE
jgi:hypothetical protein